MELSPSVNCSRWGTWQIICLAFAGIVMTVGCASNSLLNRGVLSAQDVRQDITGPYQFKSAISSTSLLLADKDGTESRVLLRGVCQTGDDTVDRASAMKLNQWLRIQDVYLLQDSITNAPSSEKKAVVLKPTTEWGGIDSSAGTVEHNIENFAIIQLWLLELGEVLVDDNDREYWLYDAFVRAEAVARKHGRGCWQVLHE